MVDFTLRKGQDVSHAAQFTNPQPLVSPDEISKRHEYAEQLEDQARTYSTHGDFHLSAQHVAAILTMDIQKFAPGKNLSMEPCEYDGRHWEDMIHMLGRNAVDFASYALKPDAELEDEPSLSEGSVDSSDLEPEEVVERYTRTIPTLEDHVLDQAEGLKCRERDGNVCIVTGNSNPRTCHIIPFTWNDTKEHNNRTRDVKQGAHFLLFISMELDARFINNPFELGGSDKAWNQICLDPELYGWWAKGYCAFKYEGAQPIGEEMMMVTLQFQWMPQVKKGPQRVMKIHSDRSDKDWKYLVRELDTFHAQGHPAPTVGGTTLRATTKTGEPLRSGHLIHVKLSKDDAERFEIVITFQWYCILFTALSGAAGNPEMLSNDSYQDKVMGWLEKKPNAAKEEGLDMD
ncbi:hypothetical protein IL306_005271 [Fusarium sp. DS 682]|nr:hypothetical protein IL306_005271 [Fusarium sp. DS 682]